MWMAATDWGLAHTPPLHPPGGSKRPQRAEATHVAQMKLSGVAHFGKFGFCERDYASRVTCLKPRRDHSVSDTVVDKS